MISTGESPPTRWCPPSRNSYKYSTIGRHGFPSSSLPATSLTDEQALHALVSLPGHVLTGDRLDALLSLTNHFGGHDPSTADALHSDGEPGGDDHGRPKDGKRKRPGKAPRNPWGPFLRLKALEMPAVYEQHLQEHGTIAIRFINDRNSLTNHITRYDHETVGDAFLACYKYTLHLDARSTMDGVRWCFTMLMYFDLVKYIRPNGSARVGCLMLEDVKAFLGPILGQTTISPDIALKQLNEWSRCGYKLDLLCQHFGPGSLFFLESLLTRNL